MKKLYLCFMCLLFASLSSGVHAKRWDPATLDVERIELAPNVYAVVDTLSAEWLEENASAATSGGFIVGEKGVLVVESFVNARLAAQMIALINEVTRKPILYVVNTSYHGDHMYGNYLFPNATIIQHEESRKYAEEHWEDDLNFMLNMFGHPDGYDGMRENSARTGDILLNDETDYIRVDLGDRKVEIRQFGFGQTKGDLQVWLPDAEVFWTGNSVIGPAPLVPWMTEGGHALSLATLKRYKEFLPEGATVVSGHSVPFKIGDENDGLEFHIDYLSALDEIARTSVENGLALMDTVDAADMPEFSAYDLFNWNHKQMNVPCAYKHYMGVADKELTEDEQAVTQHCHN
jgi:cyclase